MMSRHRSVLCQSDDVRSLSGAVDKIRRNREMKWRNELTNETHMTPSQASHILGCSARTVDRYADAKKLSAIRTPYGRLLLKAEVEALAEQRKKAPGP